MQRSGPSACWPTGLNSWNCSDASQGRAAPYSHLAGLGPDPSRRAQYRDRQPLARRVDCRGVNALGKAGENERGPSRQDKRHVSRRSAHPRRAGRSCRSMEGRSGTGRGILGRSAAADRMMRLATSKKAASTRPASPSWLSCSIKFDLPLQAFSGIDDVAGGCRTQGPSPGSEEGWQTPDLRIGPEGFRKVLWPSLQNDARTQHSVRALFRPAGLEMAYAALPNVTRA